MTTLADTQVTKNKSSNSEGLNHMVPKAKITESIVTGITIKALCGETLRPTAQPNNPGEVSQPNYLICPKCKTLYDEIKRVLF